MPTSIIIDGKKTVLPGVYPTRNTRALAGSSAQASGIVGLLGESIGGRPYTAIADRTDIRGYQSADAMFRDYPQGDLIEGANILFDPSQDPSIPGGAQTVVPLKVNPAYAAKVTLNGPTSPSLTLTSLVYGAAGNGISATVSAGSTSGVKLVLSQGNITETGDNLGDDPVGSITYDQSSWKQLFVAKADDFDLTGIHALAARSTELSGNAIAAPVQLTVTGAQADSGKRLTLYGLAADGSALQESITLTGAAQTSIGTFGAVLGASLSDAALKVTVAAGSTSVLELKGNAKSAGLATLPNLTVGNAVVKVATTEDAKKVLLVGLDPAGNPLVDVVTTTAAQPASSTKPFAKVTLAATGALSVDAQLSASVAHIGGSANLTLAALQGALATVAGLRVQVTGGDEDTPIDALDPVTKTQLNGDTVIKLTSDLEAVIDWVNSSSQLVTAAAAPGAVGLPSYTSSPVLLGGGSESAASYADWVAALKLLQQVRVNTVVCLTSDPLINQALVTHLVKMRGRGKSERDGVIGIMDPTLQGLPNYTQLLKALAGYNSSDVRAAFQAPIRVDTNGNLTTFKPHFQAAVIAGMQAGSPLGQSLTERTAKLVGLKTHPSIDLFEDDEAIVAAGGCMFRSEDGIGIKCIRNITTYTTDDNAALSEASVNQILNYVVYDLRLYMRAYLGRPNVSGTLNSIKAGLNARLTDYVSRDILQAYKPAVLTPVLDVVNVSISVAPVFPRNFIPVNLQILQSITDQAA